MRQVLRPGALGRPRGIRQRGRWEGGSGWGIHVTPWLIHVNVWQKPLQYCKVISLQLIKINGEKKTVHTLNPAIFLLKMHPQKLIICGQKFMYMSFIKAWFILLINWKQPKSPILRDLQNNVWSRNIMQLSKTCFHVPWENLYSIFVNKNTRINNAIQQFQFLLDCFMHPYIYTKPMHRKIFGGI